MRNKGRSRLFRRYWNRFLSVIALSVVLLTFLILFIYARIQIATAKEYSVAQLTQVCEMTDILHNQMRLISNQVLQSANTNRCLSTKTFNRLQEAAAAIKLRELQTSNPFVRYVGLYNSASNRFLSSSAVGFLSEDDVDYYYGALEGTNGETCTLRLIGASYSTQPNKTKVVYTFLFSVRLRNSGESDLVIVDVNDDYFARALNNLETSTGFQQVVLLDRKGQILSVNTLDPGTGTFHLSTDSQLDVEGLRLEGKSGYFSQNLTDGTEALVTWSRAPDSGLTVLNIVPYSNFYTGVPQIALSAFLAGAAVLLLGSFLSYRQSRRLSRPIEELYNDLVTTPSADRAAGDELEQLTRAVSEMAARSDKLEQGLLASYADSKKRCIQRLLHGEYAEIENYREVCARYGLDLSAPYYCIVTSRCVSTENAPSPEDSNYFICQYALENVTLDTVGKFGHVTTYRANRDMMTALLPLQQNRFPENFDTALQKIIDVMRDEFAIETTVCIGSIAEGADNINLAYEATALALEHATIGNYGKVFYANEVSERMSMNQYHNKLHLRFAEHIRAEDTEACAREFDLAISYMKDVSFSTATAYFNHVMMTLMDDFPTTYSDETAYAMLIQKLNEIDRSLQNVQNLRARCMEFISILIHHLSMHRRSGNELAVDTARTYIDKNFANPDLSLRMLAEMTGLSPAYFGKIFTAQTTFSFSDYLMNTRMKKAEQLLAETKLPIAKVSESIGLTNTNYFYSIFKKRYGMTPLAYRRAHSGGDREKE